MKPQVAGSVADRFDRGPQQMTAFRREQPVSSPQVIRDHDRWRKGVGGAPAGRTGERVDFAGSQFEHMQLSNTRTH